MIRRSIQLIGYVVIKAEAFARLDQAELTPIQIAQIHSAARSAAASATPRRGLVFVMAVLIAAGRMAGVLRSTAPTQPVHSWGMRHTNILQRGTQTTESSCRRRCKRHQQRISAVADPVGVSVGDLTPYILWDTHLMVSAAWHVQLNEGARRQGALRDDGPVMALSATCDPHCKEALVAGILKVTPAAEVRMFPCERAYLPTKALEVDTPFGTVKVDVELAGSTVVGVRADAECCMQLAERSSASADNGDTGVTAQDVADSARTAVQKGLEQGHISLGLEFLY